MTELKPQASPQVSPPISGEQRDVIDAWGKGLAVLAGAGSGKTTTLVLKCEELLRRKPDARFAAVSFTERSAGDLRAKLSKRLAGAPARLEGGPLGKHWVMTIHGLCGAILREYPREAGFDGEERMLSPAEAQLLWEQAMDSLWSDDLPENIQHSFDRLIARETRDSLRKLLRRARDLRAFGVLEKLAAAHEPDSDALVIVAAQVLERFERLKNRRGGVDFDDLERGADRALAFEHVREAYRKRFDLVLVDEFQDTNSVQARIVLALAREDCSNLCVVGDPKQSIYRFRDADVSVFEEFCSRMPVKLTLSTNFRSRPGIIDFVNRTCAPAFEVSQMRYDALVAHQEASGASEVERLDVAGPAELAKWVRSEQARGAPLEEMAVLLRKIRGNESWLKALTAAGIPLAVGSGGFFWEDPRVREMTAFLKWWYGPANAFSGAVFLRAPWMGIEDRRLDEWIREDPTFRKPFLVSEHPVALALRPLDGHVARPAELLSALLVNDAIERELGVAFLGLWHRCEELSSRGLGASSVVAELARAVEEDRREREVAPPRNQGQLQILTVHGSKGLEFPRVILLDFGPKSRAPEAPLLFWDRERGAYLAGRDSEGERDKKNPLEVEWRALEEAKNLAESKRVFYVAATRARENLLLVMPPLPEKSEAGMREKEVLAQDFWRGWIESSGIEIPANSRPIVAPERVPPPGLPARAAILPRVAPVVGRKIRPRHSVTEWNLLKRCPRAYEWTYIRPRPVAIGQTLWGSGFEHEDAQVEISQRELGTRVHACLENSDYAGLEALEREAGSARFQAAPVIAWASDPANALMRAANPADGREVYPELSFEIPIGAQVLVGSMDRVVLDENAAIIDFKITRAPKAKEALLEAYRYQMELYAAALGILLADGSGEIISAKAAPQCSLVNIASGEVQVIPVPVAIGGIDLAETAALASEIVNGAAGKPSPGARCGFCPFRGECSESQSRS